jgi:hypothetical protein
MEKKAPPWPGEQYNIVLRNQTTMNPSPVINFPDFVNFLNFPPINLHQKTPTFTNLIQTKEPKSKLELKRNQHNFSTSIETTISPSQIFNYPTTTTSLCTNDL